MTSAPVKSKLVGRPSLMLPPSFAAVEEEGGISISKTEYNFYRPLKKYHSSFKRDMVKDEEILRFDSNGGKEERALMQDKDTTWVGSSHGWLVLFDKKNRSMSLVNPVSGRSIPLPPFPFRKSKDPPVKVILSHSPDYDKCRALAIHGNINDRAAAFCSPGRSDRWSPLALGRGCRYNDFVYSASRKAFVGVKQVTRGWLGLGRATEELEFWDVASTMEAPVKTARAPPTPHVKKLARVWQTYLVTEEEESGQLFMVRRYLNRRYKKRVDYDVFRIESYFGGADVQLLPSLDDRVMFIGMNHCFAVKASRFPKYRPNCIYFSGGWNWKNGKQNKPFADVYHYKSCPYYSNREYSQLFYGNDFPFHHNLPWFTLTQDKD